MSRLSEPIPADASIHLIAGALLDGVAAGSVDPCLVHVGPAVDGAIELGFLPLRDRHPTSVLLGMVAPTNWHGMGAVTSGWGYHLHDRGSPDRLRVRMHTAVVVTRSGELAFRVAVPERPELAELLGDDAPTGEHIDLLLRTIARPTPPPPCPPSVLFAVEWLSSVLARPARALSTIEAVLALHPGATVIGALGAHADPGAAIGAWADGCDWDDVRAAVRHGRYEAPELLPSHADWFDNGSFARFLLARLPPMSLLRREIVDHLYADLVDQVFHLLRRWRIPAQVWPDAPEPSGAAVA